MQPAVSQGLFAARKQVSDSRRYQGQRHSIIAMLATVVYTTLCGAYSFKPIAQWIRIQEPEIWHWFGFK
ncbi:MAG: transposase family protein [Gimesia sp.]